MKNAAILLIATGASLTALWLFAQLLYLGPYLLVLGIIIYVIDEYQIKKGHKRS